MQRYRDDQIGWQRAAPPIGTQKASERFGQARSALVFEMVNSLAKRAFKNDHRTYAVNLVGRMTALGTDILRGP